MKLFAYENVNGDDLHLFITKLQDLETIVKPLRIQLSRILAEIVKEQGNVGDLQNAQSIEVIKHNLHQARKVLQKLSQKAPKIEAQLQLGINNAREL